jgi:hypothetical protein
MMYYPWGWPRWTVASPIDAVAKHRSDSGVALDAKRGRHTPPIRRGKDLWRDDWGTDTSGVPLELFVPLSDYCRVL